MGAFAILVLLSAVLAGEAVSLQEPKPVISEPINTYFKATPPTLSGMISKANVVVIGRVIGGKPKDTEDKGGTKYTRTGHRVQILEVLRTSGERQIASDEIEVIRAGGERDRGTYIERSYQVGFPAFENGHQYLMFLTWNVAIEGWEPAYGPDSVFDLTTGTVHSRGKSKPAQMLEGKTRTAVLEMIRGGK